MTTNHLADWKKTTIYKPTTISKNVGGWCKQFHSNDGKKVVKQKYGHSNTKDKQTNKQTSEIQPRAIK